MVDPAGVHGGDGGVERQIVLRERLARPAPQRGEEVRAEEAAGRVLHPGVDNHWSGTLEHRSSPALPVRAREPARRHPRGRPGVLRGARLRGDDDRADRRPLRRLQRLHLPPLRREGGDPRRRVPVRADAVPGRAARRPARPRRRRGGRHPRGGRAPSRLGRGQPARRARAVRAPPGARPLDPARGQPPRARRGERWLEAARRGRRDPRPRGGVGRGLVRPGAGGRARLDRGPDARGAVRRSPRRSRRRRGASFRA